MHVHTFINFVLHLDQHLLTFISNYGTWTYLVLFAIIFCETGLVITPILPGDSLLFVSGTLAAANTPHFNIHILFILLFSASFLGNQINYTLGRFFGATVFSSEKAWLLNQSYLDRAHLFFEIYGAKTLLIARFIPIIRTFAPFVAGMGYMSYRQFSVYNVIGATLWIGSLLYGSYLFGNLPFVKAHMSAIIIGIMVLSILPAAVELLKVRLAK
jgi:membrane-associated protein